MQEDYSQDYQQVEHRPISTLTDDELINYFVSGTDTEYIDLNDSYLYIKLRITNPGGTNLDSNAPMGPENLLVHTHYGVK